MTFRHGDRVQLSTADSDGFPVTRYGFVSGDHDGAGQVMALLDGELKAQLVNPEHLAPVTISTVKLVLTDSGLLDDPSLLQALVNMWTAEADDAGLDIDAVEAVTPTRTDADDGYVVAYLRSADELYTLRACRGSKLDDTVHVGAERQAPSAT